jgi:hypothetical protein
MTKVNFKLFFVETGSLALSSFRKDVVRGVKRTARRIVYFWAAATPAQQPHNINTIIHLAENYLTVRY